MTCQHENCYGGTVQTYYRVGNAISNSGGFTLSSAAPAPEMGAYHLCHDHALADLGVAFGSAPPPTDVWDGDNA